MIRSEALVSGREGRGLFFASSFHPLVSATIRGQFVIELPRLDEPAVSR